MRKDVEYIPLANCKHGYTYKINSRNLSFGVYDKDTQGFVGIRTKFGERYLFTEFHWDTGAPFGTVRPKKELEKCPIQNLDESYKNTDLFNYLDTIKTTFVDSEE